MSTLKTLWWGCVVACAAAAPPLLWSSAAIAAGGVRLCVPDKEGAPALTPKAGACKAKYKLVELGSQGRQGREGTEGRQGKQGPAGAPGAQGPTGLDGPAAPAAAPSAASVLVCLLEPCSYRAAVFSSSQYEALRVEGESVSHHAATILQTARSGGGAALNLVSENPEFSTLEVSGLEGSHGTVKVSHTNVSGSPTGDSNAAMLSLESHDGAESGTAVQGIYMKPGSPGNTGNWITVKGPSDEKLFALKATGVLELSEQAEAPGKPEAGRAYLYLRGGHLFVKTADGAEHRIF
jgi:hypothetical protein